MNARERRVQPLDPRQVELGQLARGHLSRAQQLAQPGDAGEREIVVRAGASAGCGPGSWSASGPPRSVAEATISTRSAAHMGRTPHGQAASVRAAAGRARRRTAPPRPGSTRRSSSRSTRRGARRSWARSRAAAAVCLFVIPRASSRSTSTSRAVSPAGGSAGGPRPLADRLQHRVDRLTGQLAGVRLLAQLAAPPRSRSGPADGRAARSSRTTRRPRRARARPARAAARGHAAVIAGAVESLVVRGGGAGELAQRRDPGEQPLGVVAVKPHLLPLAARQRPRLLPHGGRDADATQVVQPRGAVAARRSPRASARAATPRPLRPRPPTRECPSVP